MPDFIAIDTESTGLNYRKGDRAYMVTACTDEGKEYLWRFDVDPLTRKVIYDKAIVQSIIKVLSKIKRWIFHNAAFDIPILRHLHKYFNERNVFGKHEIHDTQLIGHHYASLEKRGLKERALLHLDYPDSDEKELHKAVKAAVVIAGKRGWKIGSKENTPHVEKNFYKTDYWVPHQLAKALKYDPDHPWLKNDGKYAIGDVVRTAGLFIFYRTNLPKNQWDVYENHRKVILPIIAMQDRGVHLLSHEIGPTKVIFQRRAKKLLHSMRLLCGDPKFNPASPKQLQNILFVQYKFEPIKFGKAGPSTDKFVLEELEATDPDEVYDEEGLLFIKTLVQYRKCLTTISFLDNYNRHAINNTLHTSYHQVGTSTVRVSASDPNTQNVGKNDNPFSAEQTFKLRTVFGPASNRVWYCGDYDQFQIRIFATAANDSYLLKAFEEGVDCHHAVACKMFKTDSPTDLQRRAAKAINFGILFGAGPKKIESFSKMPGSFEMYAKQFPTVFSFLEAAEKQARRTGFVYTLGGYRLQVPRKTTYAGSCYIIQGTEAEIVKMAMVRVDDYLYNAKSELKMILQVHDELIFDAPADMHLGHDLLNVQRIMVEESVKLGIPASVDFKSTTTNWASVSNYDLAV